MMHLVQYIFSISYGFFLYDIIIGILTNKKIFIIHGGAGAIGLSFMMCPFAQYMGSAFILFELSSIPYNIRMIMIYTNNGYGKLFNFIEALFAITFIFVRIMIGVPFILSNTPVMLDIVYNGDLYSKFYSIVILSTGYTIMGLNCYWSRNIMKRIILTIRQ